jgi:hypothetical protein
MHALLLCIASALPSVEDWTPLPAPWLCRAGLEAWVPPVLSSGSHLELARAEARPASEAQTAPLSYATFLQIVEEDARAHGARLEVQRFEGGALIRGEKPAIAAARAIGESLEAAGRALDVDLVVVMKPLAAGAKEPPLRFERRVRSGDTTFFGTRETLSFVAGFSVQVAAESGQSEPIIGRAHHGRGLHLSACRVAGGERVFVQGFLDVAEIAEVTEFDPDTADLGVLQQPRVVWTQAEFAGTTDAAGTLAVEVHGTGGAASEWTVEIQARTQKDELLADAAGDSGGFVVFDLAFSSAPALASNAGLAALFSGDKPAAASDSAVGSIPPSAIASLVEAARGPTPRGGRPSLYWSDRLLLVPRADASAVSEARSLVRRHQAARLAELRVDCKIGGLSATLPLCGSGRARFVSGSERPLLVEYRLEVAPQIWMPQPICESVFDGTCFELRPGAGSVDVVLSTATTNRVAEINRENAQIGRLQTLDRRRFFGGTRVGAGLSGKIELSGFETGQAVVRCERR